MKKILLAIGLLIIIELAIVLGMLLVKGGKMIAILEVLGLLVATIVTGIGAAYSLTKFNLFWTLNREGESKAITSFGAFVRGIVQYQGYRDRTGKDGEVVADPNWRPPWWSRLTGGLKWVGVPPFRKVHIYMFRWATFKMSTKEGEPPQMIIHRVERLDYIFVKPAPYVLEMVGVETKGMVPLNLQLPFLAQCVNIHKALFKIHDWLITASLLLQPKIRELVAGQEFDTLIRDRMRVVEELKSGLKGLEITDILKKIEDDFGIRISGLDLSSIEPTRAEDRETALKEWQSQQEAKAKIALAQGTKQATITEAKGQKQAIILTAEGEKKAAVLKGQGRAEALELVARRIAAFKYGELVATIDGYVDMGKNGKLVIASGLDGFLRDIGTRFGKKQADLMEKMFSQFGIKEEDFMNFLKWKLEQKGGTK